MFRWFFDTVNSANERAFNPEVQVHVVRGQFAGKPVLRAYDENRSMYMVFDDGRNQGQSEWFETVDRSWWDSVKQRTCGSR